MKGYLWITVSATHNRSRASHFGREKSRTHIKRKQEAIRREKQTVMNFLVKSHHYGSSSSPV